MKVIRMACILFSEVTMLDFHGFFDAVTRLNRVEGFGRLSYDLCALEDEITDDRGISVRIPNRIPDLSGYDILFIPGGMGTRQLQIDPKFLAWLRTAEPVPLKISVCTGALLLGAAGFLEGKRATTNPGLYEGIRPYCSEVLHSRIVRDGGVITAGGVAASIDLGLYVAEQLAGVEAVRTVQKSMDYPYYRAGLAALDRYDAAAVDASGQGRL
ncbi:cyclohexyl-isocyanide hydratase [Paenibacillus mucilaginosus]|uniref:DJ-1/PfpI family protein n=1 Tax=Paenibacillus mucilaginosus TaxID=61624 RepID=UPI003D23AEA5